MMDRREPNLSLERLEHNFRERLDDARNSLVDGLATAEVGACHLLAPRRERKIEWYSTASSGLRQGREVCA